jgi:predicted ATP-dependent endonuclease of OLD family
MIKQLKIENFRCFGKSTLSGFERVNLIGGQNNSGKTAFLEALYLNQSPLAATVMRMRGINKETILAFPERAWNGLFLNHDSKRLGKIISNVDDNSIPVILQLSFHYSSQPDIINKYDIGFDITEDLREIRQICSSFAHSENYILELSYQANTEETPLVLALISSIDNGTKNIKLGRKPSNKVAELQSISFISATEKASSRYLAEQYDKCYLQGYDEKVKDAFHIIDPSITEIRTLMSGEPTLYLSRKNQRPMSIELFGDAMNRVAHFALEPINNQAGILLVDEIENGIHHSHQKQLWQWLFALAVELDVQIFATTHSLEMLTAFKEAAMGTQYESEVAYFEFARHVKTGEIIAIKREIDNLDYALERNKGIRGE